MREQWTVEYRDWIGRSRKGYTVRRLRNGRGKWRHRYAEVPDHVRQFLDLKPMPARGNGMVLSGICSERKLHECRVRFPARARDRFMCEIESPKDERGVPSVSPRTVGRQFDYAEGPGEVYRIAYKYTGCGPAIGFKLEGRPTSYCSSLNQLGTWEDMRKRGERIEYLTVSSIVEGVDAETETIEVPCRPVASLLHRFNLAVEEVDRQATEIWNDTHGCPKCGPELDGAIPINPKCKACKGQGVIL